MTARFTLLWWLAVGFGSLTGEVPRHDGPDPVAHWQFNQRNVAETKVKARFGPDGTFSHKPKLVTDACGQAVAFDGRRNECLLAADYSSVREVLPQRDLTISAVVAIDGPETWGGVIGVLQDDGDAESGWILGYNENVITFGLASTGANDGDGKITYLTGKTPYQRGKYYHVVAVYDGQIMQLYVNGQLEAESREQSGDILYPPQAPYVIGAYHDDNEFYSFQGRLREIAVYDLAAKAKWVREEFDHHRTVAELPVAQPPPSKLHFVVEPFLQYGTETGMTIVWQTSQACPGAVCWGEDIRCTNRIDNPAESAIQQIRIEGLQPETQYFYRIESKFGDDILESEPSTFQTACRRGTPFAFVVISDTQQNPEVAGAICELAWAQRPHFILHPGDLVDLGTRNGDWLDEFFPSMHPLISRVPMFPVLGNHEENAKNYFDYMALPDPEYYYTFSYGDADFFMIDSNRKVDPESEQYRWLELQLAASTATWKFACHHHPPYSSDENDYGDLWKTNQSTRGDPRVRDLVPLYEKYGVDLVWNGHIHSYERTWPIRGEQAVEVGGTIYMITGGGGGSLETPGPYRPFFQNNVRRGHHYTMVCINGKTLELKSFSLDDRLFDSLRIEKQ